MNAVRAFDARPWMLWAWLAGSLLFALGGCASQGADSSPEVFTASDEPEGRTTINDHLEHPAQDVAVRKATVTVLGKGRPVRHAALKPKAAKPAIDQIEMNLINQPPLRSDALEIADHQLRIDQWPASVAVKCLELMADRAEVQQPVNPAQKMTGGDVILDTEPANPCILNLLPAHHARSFNQYTPI